MNPDWVSGFETGTVDYEIPANNYTRSLERHDQRVLQESYNYKISDCNTDIRRNQKKQKQLIKEKDDSF
jgi:hypothetical protein